MVLFLTDKVELMTVIMLETIPCIALAFVVVMSQSHHIQLTQ